MNTYAYPPPLPLALRTSPDTTFTLSGKHSPEGSLVSIPAALTNGAFPLLEQDEWRERTDRLWVCLSRWAWSLPQRIIVLVLGALTLIVPMVGAILVNRSVFGGETALSDDATPEQIQQRINEIRRAHLITFAIVLGIYICIWTPYLVFSLIARKRINAILRSFNELDAKKGDMSALQWSILRVSTLARSATFHLVIPPAYISAHQVTNFRPEAYLPPYLRKDPHPAPKYNAPADGRV